MKVFRRFDIVILLAVLVSLTAAVGVLVHNPEPPLAQPPGKRVIATSIPTLEPTAEPTPVQTAPEPTPLRKTERPKEPGPEPRVAAYQRRLLDLGYWLPQVNGLRDEHTAHTVIAFQKVAGLERNGVLDSPTKEAIEEKIRPSAQSTVGRTVEIDKRRQILMIVKDGEVRWILDASTGKPSTPTASGRFTIYKQYDALRISRLGRLWRPKYFWRGQAIHGFTSVPSYPASHGCVRLTYTTMDWLWKKDALPIGTPVWIY